MKNLITFILDKDFYLVYLNGSYYCKYHIGDDCTVIFNKIIKKIKNSNNILFKKLNKDICFKYLKIKNIKSLEEYNKHIKNFYKEYNNFEKIKELIDIKLYLKKDDYFNYENTIRDVYLLSGGKEDKFNRWYKNFKNVNLKFDELYEDELNHLMDCYKDKIDNLDDYEKELLEYYEDYLRMIYEVKK